MDLSTAQQLIVHEGTDPQGLVVEARAGIDPGRERVRTLIDALQSIYEAMHDETSIDRQLAYAMYSLAAHLGDTIAAWQECEWIDDYAEMLAVIESIFEGE